MSNQNCFDFTRYHRWTTLLLTLVCLSFLTNAQAQNAQAQNAQAQPAAIVNMTDEMTFEPRTVEIKRGETVLWKNPSSLVHTVTADPKLANDKSHVQLPKGAKTFHSGAIKPGGEYRHTFNVPGRYRYFCVPHEAAGMVGEVIVR
jgi:plastocyanin